MRVYFSKEEKDWRPKANPGISVQETRWTSVKLAQD